LLEGKDASGATSEWSEIPLEHSFYRQLPRGATIKIRSRSSRGDVPSSGLASASLPIPQNSEAVAEMNRLSNERDVVLTALEEVVNERSRMAAQIGELKSMIAHAVGTSLSGDMTPEAGEIDVGKELKAAHNEICSLIQESEATVNVLEGLLADGKKRNAELEDRVSGMERDIAILRDQHGKALLSHDEDSSRIELLKKEVGELNSQLKSAREHQAADNSTSFGSSGGGSHLWAMLSNARADAEEERQGRERAERRIAELQTLAKSPASVNEPSVSPVEVKREREAAVAEVERAKKVELQKIIGEMESMKSLYQREKEEAVSETSRALASVAEKNGQMEELERRVRRAELDADTAKMAVRESEAVCAEMRAIVGARREEPTREDVIHLQALLRGLQEERMLNEKKHQIQLDNAMAQVAAAESKALERERELQEAEVAAAKAIDAERRLRKALEAQRNAIEMESKAWMGQQRSEDMSNRTDGSDFNDISRSKLAGTNVAAGASQSVENHADIELVQSSSKRGLRKASSKVQIAKKKAARAQSSVSGPPGPEEVLDGKKKGGHRLRLFG
jgi:hypothetical protein